MMSSSTSWQHFQTQAVRLFSVRSTKLHSRTGTRRLPNSTIISSAKTLRFAARDKQESTDRPGVAEDQK